MYVTACTIIGTVHLLSINVLDLQCQGSICNGAERFKDNGPADEKCACFIQGTNRENGVAFSFNVEVRCPDGVTYNVMNWIDLRFLRLALFQDSGMYGLMAKTITKHSTLMRFIKRGCQAIFNEIGPMRLTAWVKQGQVQDNATGNDTGNAYNSVAPTKLESDRMNLHVARAVANEIIDDVKRARLNGMKVDVKTEYDRITSAIETFNVEGGWDP
jgi:hypothetical protein